MNKRKFLNKTNIDEVANFLKDSIHWLVKEQCGCCCYSFALSEDLAIYVGWSGGYDATDESIIRSEEVGLPHGGWCECYAVTAAVKIRNDYDCADYDFLDFPWDKETGECMDNAFSIGPNADWKAYRTYARWLLDTFVELTNSITRGKTVLNYEEVD